ncbi:hypothetical protein PUW87_02245 [Metamycoplasma hyosynoviae]|uniref:Uncharacterized protein n=3 Tax=Metamycoplasma hyosynoviae TaxID=29559 RepID=A0A4R7TYQ3_9BACT|nr:hypothetical protein [Metamycoplasma hyosynoviae]MDC8900821.1 hypothetical protein [Metamycoplasma hyosynoviae]MDC8912336.1 hypothetical protein [Metamycoplasma hyosynoviae]MDC8913501.1 hypothetical protein [Metamycoplasma hyosynoviae]MDC8915055.1 hypothetical protein [Metamycoplasma hyosynoviae]MDC8915894.1 hypothetical protein [Metamycoplasma hyosynoviae]
MQKKELFTKKEKDLTVSAHYSIKGSLVKKIEKDAEKYNITKSKIVNTILEDYYKDK